jgi:hypothetical protein
MLHGVIEPISRQRPGTPKGKKIPAVCGRCNNEWMNDLETAARPHLTPLISGVAYTLTDEIRNVLVRWVAMKTLVVDHDRPMGRAVAKVVHPQTDRDRLMHGSIPPPNFNVWFGYGSEPGWAFNFVRSYAVARPEGEVWPPLEPPPNVHTLAWGLNHLRIFVLATTSIEVQRLASLWSFSSLVPVWPLLGRAAVAWPVTWPPKKITTDAEMDQAAHALRLAIIRQEDRQGMYGL